MCLVDGGSWNGSGCSYSQQNEAIKVVTTQIQAKEQAEQLARQQEYDSREEQRQSALNTISTNNLNAYKTELQNADNESFLEIISNKFSNAINNSDLAKNGLGTTGLGGGGGIVIAPSLDSVKATGPTLLDAINNPDNYAVTSGNSTANSILSGIDYLLVPESYKNYWQGQVSKAKSEDNYLDIVFNQQTILDTGDTITFDNFTPYVANYQRINKETYDPNLSAFQNYNNAVEAGKNDAETKAQTVKLGTIIATELYTIAVAPQLIVTAATTGGAGAAVVTALGQAQVVSTVYQTGNTTSYCTLNGWDQNCQQQTARTGLSWATMGASQLANTSTGLATAYQQGAKVLNTVANAANFAVDSGDVAVAFTDPNADSLTKAMSIVAVLGDVGGGIMDYKQGQLGFTAPKVDLPADVNLSKANIPLVDIKKPVVDPVKLADAPVNAPIEITPSKPTIIDTVSNWWNKQVVSKVFKPAIDIETIDSIPPSIDKYGIKPENLALVTSNHTDISKAQKRLINEAEKIGVYIYVSDTDLSIPTSELKATHGIEDGLAAAIASAGPPYENAIIIGRGGSINEDTLLAVSAHELGHHQPNQNRYPKSFIEKVENEIKANEFAASLMENELDLPPDHPSLLMIDQFVKSDADYRNSLLEHPEKDLLANYYAKKITKTPTYHPTGVDIPEGTKITMGIDTPIVEINGVTHPLEVGKEFPEIAGSKVAVDPKGNYHLVRPDGSVSSLVDNRSATDKVVDWLNGFLPESKADQNAFDNTIYQSFKPNGPRSDIVYSLLNNGYSPDKINDTLINQAINKMVDTYREFPIFDKFLTFHGMPQYGSPPKNVNLPSRFKNNLLSFQEKTKSLVSGGNITVDNVFEIVNEIEANGFTKFVFVESLDDVAKAYDGDKPTSGTRPMAFAQKMGNVNIITIAKPNAYKDHFKINDQDSVIFFSSLVAHEGGHANNNEILGTYGIDPQSKSSLWGDEYLQQKASLEILNSTPEKSEWIKKTIKTYQDYVDEVERRIILNFIEAK